MTGADKTYCEGCGHMARYGSGIEPTCDYLIHTGRRRPCAYGVGCTAHTRREAKKAEPDSYRAARENAACDEGARQNRQGARGIQMKL